MRTFSKISLLTGMVALLFGATFFFFYPLTVADVAPNSAFSNILTIPPQSTKTDLDVIGNNKFIFPENDKVVYINLDKQTLELFDKGVRVKSFPVLSIGREGSPWQTPVGEYQIRNKELVHFSTIGEVWMPYSMQFFGNFFIHGWPFYTGGIPVPEGYSGGCIRLSVKDAQEVFLWVDVGTKVSISRSTFEDKVEISPEGDYYSKTGRTTLPRVSAYAYLAADVETEDILLARKYTEVRPVASVTKLMTALTSLEVVNQFQDTFFEGLNVKTGALIYPLLLESSNKAAEVLADHVGKIYFVDSMNAKAEAIGLRDTHFSDSSGLSPENTSSARDLFKLLQHLARNKPFIIETTLLPKYEITAGYGYTWRNNSPIFEAKISGYRGGKHGYIDEAGKTLVALFDVPLDEFEGRKIAIILLGSQDLRRDTEVILNYLNKNFYWGLSAEENITTL